MGKVKSGVIGKVTGSVGPVVFSVVNGQQVVKEQPTKSTKPATQSQIDVREIFRLTTEAMNNFAEVINTGYKIHKQSSTPVNTAVKYHIKNAITGISPDFALDFTKVRLSNGAEDSDNDVQVQAADAGAMMNITWSPEVGGSQKQRDLRNTDLACIVFYHIAKGRYISSIGEVKRGVGKFDMKVPNSFAGTPMHAWIFFASEDGTKSFRSEYLGTHTAKL